MAVPSWLNYAARYLLITGVTDVATIITNLETELVTNGTWTKPSAGVFKMAVDSLGRYAQLTTSGGGGTRLGFKITEHFGNTIYDGAVDIDVAGTNVAIFSGPGYCWVDTLRVTPEGAFVFKLDTTPEPDVDPWPWSVWAFRTAAGAATSNSAFGYSFINGTTNGTYTNSDSWCEQQFAANNTSLGSGMSYSGAYTFWPVSVFHNFTGSWNFAGKLPNCVMSNEAITATTEIAVPVDTGTTKTFRAPSSGKALSASWNLRLLIKKST